MASVAFRSVTRAYAPGAAPAVSALDLDVRDGELMVLVGPSGSGKSTCLRMLAGLEPVDAGRILIGDRDVTDLSAGDRDIAMVFRTTRSTRTSRFGRTSPSRWSCGSCQRTRSGAVSTSRPPSSACWS